MVFEQNRAAAEKNLNYFIDNKLSNYSKLRNFSADTLNRLTTSKLSPYITHGILNEAEVIKEILEIGDTLCGYVLIIDGLKLTFRKVKLNKRSDCYCNEI